MSSKIFTINTDNNSSVTFTKKSNAFNIFEEPVNNLWTFDLEGRLVGMFVDRSNYRRTLNNTFYIKIREELSGESFRSVEQVGREIVGKLIERAHILIENNQDKLPKSFDQIISKILKMDYAALEKDASNFSNVYLPISILPPDQYMSLVVQLTEGCNYNLCTFCNFYKDRPFKIKSIEELHTHLKNVKTFLGKGIKLRKSVFLADANAISVPQKRLSESLKFINSEFPDINNIYSFVDVFTGLKKSINDFKILKQLGLTRVYLGVESGNTDLMSFLNKHQLNSDIIELTRVIQKSGINIGVIFLIGAGGETFTKSHLNDSVELIKKLKLRKGDIVYLSELNETNHHYIRSMQDSGFDLPTKEQIRAWSNNFKKQVKNVVSQKVKVSIYDINQFFY